MRRKLTLTKEPKRNRYTKKSGAKKTKPPKREPIKRSGFEDDFFMTATLRGWEVAFEPIRLPYVVPEQKRHYLPDFVFDPKALKVLPTITSIEDLRGKIIIETKGLLTAKDRAKMLLVKKTYPWMDIRMVFQRDNWVTNTKKMRYSQWAERHGFPWYVGHAPPESWFLPATV